MKFNNKLLTSWLGQVTRSGDYADDLKHNKVTKGYA